MKNCGSLLWLVICLAFFKSAVAIYCYQCNSTQHKDPFQCNEYMEDTDLQPTDCSTVYDAKYCVKRTGRFEGGYGTRRFCSSLDLGTYCNYVRHRGDIHEYRSCIYTCSSDGCNGSTRSVTQLSSSLLILSVLCVRLISR